MNQLDETISARRPSMSRRTAAAFNASHWIAVDAAAQVLSGDSKALLLAAEPGHGVGEVLDAALDVVRPDEAVRKDEGAEGVTLLRLEPEAADLPSIATAAQRALATDGELRNAAEAVSALRHFAGMCSRRGRSAVLALCLPSSAALDPGLPLFLECLVEPGSARTPGAPDDRAAPMRMLICTDFEMANGLKEASPGMLDVEAFVALRPHGLDEARCVLAGVDFDASADLIEAIAAAHQASGGSPVLIRRLEELIAAIQGDAITSETIQAALSRLDAEDPAETRELRLAALQAAALTNMPEPDASQRAAAPAPQQETPPQQETSPPQPPVDVTAAGPACSQTPAEPERLAEPVNIADRGRRALRGRSGVQRYAATLGFASAAALIVIGALSAVTPTLRDLAGAPRPEASEIGDGMRAIYATRALLRAEQHRRAGRLTGPKGASAYDAVLEAAKWAPRDPRVAAAFERLIAHYRSRANSARDAGEYDAFYRLQSIVDRIRHRRPI